MNRCRIATLLTCTFLCGLGAAPRGRCQEPAPEDPEAPWRQLYLGEAKLLSLFAAQGTQKHELTLHETPVMRWVSFDGFNGDVFVWLRDGRLVEAGGERLTYSGVALLRPELLAGAPGGRFPLLPWLNRAREAGRLGGQKHTGRWLDIGTPQRLAPLDAELAPMRG